jgi:hypothetical protein
MNTGKVGENPPKGEYRDNSTLSLLSARYGGWSTPRTGRFTPRERDPEPTVQEAEWAQSLPVWTGAENLGFDTRTVQPVATRYNDYDIPRSS